MIQAGSPPTRQRCSPTAARPSQTLPYCGTRQQSSALSPRHRRLGGCSPASPADQCASKGEEGFVAVVAYLPADPQAAEPVQVGERTLHDPAVGAESGSVPGAPAGDKRLYAEVPDEAAVLVVVVAAVARHHVRAVPGPAAPATALMCRSRRTGRPVDTGVVEEGARRITTASGCADVVPAIERGGVCASCWSEPVNGRPDRRRHRRCG
jgi:hypothetical protein